MTRSIDQKHAFIGYCALLVGVRRIDGICKGAVAIHTYTLASVCGELPSRQTFAGLVPGLRLTIGFRSAYDITAALARLPDPRLSSPARELSAYHVHLTCDRTWARIFPAKSLCLCRHVSHTRAKGPGQDSGT